MDEHGNFTVDESTIQFSNRSPPAKRSRLDEPDAPTPTQLPIVEDDNDEDWEDEEPEPRKPPPVSLGLLLSTAQENNHGYTVGRMASLLGRYRGGHVVLGSWPSLAIYL